MTDFPPHSIIGVNKRSYPAEYGRGAMSDEGASYVDVTIVLVSGEVGDYAAYIGSGSPSFVQRFGNKLSFDEACVHFPGQLEKEYYRD